MIKITKYPDVGSTLLLPAILHAFSHWPFWAGNKRKIIDRSIMLTARMGRYGVTVALLRCLIRLIMSNITLLVSHRITLGGGGELFFSFLKLFGSIFQTRGRVSSYITNLFDKQAKNKHKSRTKGGGGGGYPIPPKPPKHILESKGEGLNPYHPHPSRVIRYWNHRSLWLRITLCIFKLVL